MERPAVPGMASVLDMRGAQCPWPVLKAAKRLRELPPGAVLTLIATDPMARLDVPHFCSTSGHSLLDVSEAQGILTFRILNRPVTCNA